jgi:hypothetical protein
MADQFLGKKVTIVDDPTKSPFVVWHPDILLRLNDFCASPNMFAEGEISGGYVRDMLRDARDEIARLRLTDEEREAIHFMFRHAAQAADHDPFPDSADYIPHHKVISAMMERLK